MRRTDAVTVGLLLISDSVTALRLPGSVNANVNKRVPLQFTYLLCASTDCFDFVVYKLLNSSRKCYFWDDEAHGDPFPLLFSPPLPISSPSLSLPFFLLSLPLEEGLPNPARESEEHCNLPQHGPMVNTLVYIRRPSCCSALRQVKMVWTMISTIQNTTNK